MEKVHSKAQSKTKKKYQNLSLKLKNSYYKLRGFPLQIDLKPYFNTLNRINSLDLYSLDDKGLKNKAAWLKQQVAEGVPLDELLVEAYALVREVAHRCIGLKPFDVQILAGIVMDKAKIAELPTGEGKTLAAVFPAYLNALSGRGVHILTFNDYLARRDAAWMGPIYEFLGLTVGCNQEGMSIPKKYSAYACDITYSTAKEAGFDLLRDSICYDKKNQIHRPFHFALVDEADSILIDEARIPLVIAGLKDKTEIDSLGLSDTIKRMIPRVHYQTDDAKRNVLLTDSGLEYVEQKLECGNLFSLENIHILTALNCALHAEVLLKRDKDYIIRKGKIEIIDEFTGRVVKNRHWPDGLQAAVEEKENISFKSKGSILGSITLQHFFRLYPRLCGMTATARTSAEEFKEFYGLSVVIVPPNFPCIRIDHEDLIYMTRAAKHKALIKEIRDVHISGRPVLVGTGSVEESEYLALVLKEAGITCQVLNAKNDEKEAKIIAQGGAVGAVTVSTNMAGRGTDIRLGEVEETDKRKVSSLGGLYVIGTSRHDSLRIDNQLRGRAGRQGDQGASRFFISLEDDFISRSGTKKLLTRFIKQNIRENRFTNKVIRKEIARAQRIIDGQNFEIRKTLWNYSSLIEKQRQVFHNKRKEILLWDSSFCYLKENAPGLYRLFVQSIGKSRFLKLEKQVRLVEADRYWAEHLAYIADLRESIHLEMIGGKTPLEEFQKTVTHAFIEMQKKWEKGSLRVFYDLSRRLDRIELEGKELKGPSSTWTYLINDEQSGWGIEMGMGRNIGFTAGAALALGPLYLFLGIYNRWIKKS